MLLSIVPIAYLLLKYCDVAPECVFIVHIIVELFTQYARLRMVLPMINMPLDFYVKQVIRPIVIVMIFSSSIPFLLYANGFTNEGWISFILTTIICAICTLISVYFIGCKLPERKFFIGRIKNSIPKSISINQRIQILLLYTNTCSIVVKSVKILSILIIDKNRKYILCYMLGQR